jgi:hypothetical protein
MSLSLISVSSQRERSCRPLTKLLQYALDQVLSLHHDVPKFVSLRPRNFSLQCWQVVRQQIPEQDSVVIRKD